MKNKPTAPIFVCQATLWDTQHQLSGSLELWEDELVFQPDSFKESHLKWIVPLASIQKVEEFLVFDLARNGLWIEGQYGQYDLFVLEEVASFKQHLIQVMTRTAKNQ